MEQEEIKRVAGSKGVDLFVRSGMKLGFGTGSTAIWAVRRAAELLSRGELTDIIAVATSSQTEMECIRLGIPLKRIGDPEIHGELDITIDGADEIDERGNLIKGGGGALLMEKIAAYASKKFVIVADESKLVTRLGKKFPVPVEVFPEAWVPVVKRIKDLGGDAEVRMAVRKMGAVITDNGNYILDIKFNRVIDAEEYEVLLNQIPGVFENGLFTVKKPEILIGNRDGSVTQTKSK